MRFLFLWLFVFQASVVAQNANNYKLEEITEIDDGMMGSKKLYFKLACNQVFLQNLVEPVDSNTYRVGILTKFKQLDCNQPARAVYSRISAGGKTLVAADNFGEIWFCEGACFTPGGPDMPPYNRYVEAYGTSKAQAIDLLGCGAPYLQHLRCSLIDINTL